jgi:hypothetical protein
MANKSSDKLVLVYHQQEFERNGKNNLPILHKVLRFGNLIPTCPIIAVKSFWN